MLVAVGCVYLISTDYMPISNSNLLTTNTSARKPQPTSLHLTVQDSRRDDDVQHPPAGRVVA